MMPTENPKPPLLRDAQVRSRYDACGRGVEFLMTAPEFATMKFGAVSRLIVGCIARGHYFFIVDEAGKVQGFCGWAQVTPAAAEAWLEQNRDIASQSDGARTVCAINLWKAANPAVNSAMIGALRRRLSRETNLLVARRFYADGRMRPLRLTIAPHQLRG